MNSLTKLFRLLEVSRSQPQYGYALSEIRQADLSNLAEHHYLVTIMAWQLAAHATRAGGKVDTTKVLEISLTHDLGELFGGDIGFPYGRLNPKARQLAKEFEKENQRYLSDYFEEKEHFLQLAAESMELLSDEGIIAKVADYLEVTHYKLYLRRLTPGDVSVVARVSKEMVAKMHDPKSSAALLSLLEQWEEDMAIPNPPELFEEGKQ